MEPSTGFATARIAVLTVINGYSELTLDGLAGDDGRYAMFSETQLPMVNDPQIISSSDPNPRRSTERTAYDHTT